MLREIVESVVNEGVLDKFLGKIEKIGVKYSKYIAKMYTDKQGQYGSKMATIDTAHVFPSDTLATGYLTGIYQVKSGSFGQFIGLSKVTFKKGDKVLLSALKKFDDLGSDVYVVKKA